MTAKLKPRREMKKTVTLSEFRADFKEIRPENFSHEGLEVLFEHLESIEESTGEELEFDVVAICCDFSEVPLEDLLGDDEGLASSETACGEIIGRTGHSVVIFNN